MSTKRIAKQDGGASATDVSGSRPATVLVTAVVDVGEREQDDRLRTASSKATSEMRRCAWNVKTHRMRHALRRRARLEQKFCSQYVVVQACMHQEPWRLAIAYARI